MLEHRGELGLAHEAFDETRVFRQVREQALEGDDPLETLDSALFCAVDGGHATDPEPLVHQVGPEDFLAQVRVRILWRC
ncbi:MAG TPA: hypothetical protein VM734_23390 [Kofleriaceae bacterium]|nr:hypothetical protein [Kofleriaceae bacterium]